MKLTPAQQQYITIKQQHKDCILLFRIGDFYEMFYEDAHIAHRVLDITLTSRDKSVENPIPMAGIPHHALERYLPRFIKAGYKVAIAEQVGEVFPGRVVDRKVSRIVTAATYIEQASSWGFLCGVSMTNAPDCYHCGMMEVVTGVLHTVSFEHRDALIKYILKWNPSEVVLDIDIPERSSLESYIHTLLGCSMSISDVPINIENFIKHHLQISSLQGYGKALLEGRERIFGVLANYLLYTLKQEQLFFTHISYGFSTGIVHLDDTTIRNLEIFSSSYEQKSQHSLFALINTCRTSMGSRLLMERLQYPSNNLDILQDRQRLLAFFEDQDMSLWNSFFESIPDIAKTLSILSYKGAIGSRIQQIRNLWSLLLEWWLVQDILWKQYNLLDIDRCRQFFSSLESAVVSFQPQRDQGYIEDGYDQEVDRLRQLVFHTDDVLLDYQQQVIQITGISSVRLKYIQNQWYFLEIGKQHQTQFESCARMDDEQLDFSRRSSLKAGERFVTTYLENLEGRIIDAKLTLAKRESVLLEEIRETILSEQALLLQRASILADYDLASSHLQFAKRSAWTCPSFHSISLEIMWARHPLVESFLAAHEQFVPNDLSYVGKDSFHLITGPNMGGKTTYLKQNALILLLAHAWLYVPALSASLPLVDAIFARIGTGDILAKQQSTFMTEMIEMANILHNATDRSFLVLDEIGRGTSTYDGLALARGICDYLLTKTKAKTLFATHYHELITLEKEYDNFHNYSVSVYETAESVVFLKKIVKGGASKSYGIDVALRAGIPQSVIDNAKKHLKGLESQKNWPTIVQQWLFVAPLQEVKKIEIERSLEEIDINSMTPMQALVYVSELKKLAS
jgi:DNA mismatch repair protein MutS